MVNPGQTADTCYSCVNLVSIHQSFLHKVQGIIPLWQWLDEGHIHSAGENAISNYTSVFIVCHLMAVLCITPNSLSNKL